MTDMYPLPKRLTDIHFHPIRGSDGSELIDQMDQNSVELALVLGLPCANEDMLCAVKNFPDRLVGGVFCDPRSGQEAIEQVKRYHGQGIRVVKLMPNFGYWPDDDAFEAFFDTVAALNMAVLSHCGWLMPGLGVSASYYSNPSRFEKLIRSHPNTPFIFAHMGGISGFLDAIMLATRADNVFVDTAPGQGTWVLENAGKMVGSIPPGKILWGSDSVVQDSEIQQVRRLLIDIGLGPHLEDIFYSNARRLLKQIGAM